MNAKQQQQLAEWVERQLDARLSEDEFLQLQQLLLHDSEARQLYLDLRQQHAHLQLDRRQLDRPLLAPSALLAQGTQVSPDRTISPSRQSTIVVSIAAVVCLLMIWWAAQPGSGAAETLAEIVETSDARWGDSSLPTAVGSVLGKGRLKIDRGLVVLRFRSGAEVTLEAPAELQIESRLSGRLLSGTALLQVPESAHGFTLHTPTAVAIDYGTAFAVTVDPASGGSAIEVQEGEVEVQHPVSEKSVRLRSEQRVFASQDQLGVASKSAAETQLFDGRRPPGEQTHRITTSDGSGGDCSVSRGRQEAVTRNSHPDLVLIKNPYAGYEQFARKGYFRFDLTSVPPSPTPITSAAFVLTLQPSGLGYASAVGDCQFSVYGLSDEGADDWSAEGLVWESAPANGQKAAELDPRQTIKLGQFVVPRGVQHGLFAVRGEALTAFLNADTNQSVTLIVVRDTVENQPGGLVHGFISSSGTAGAPPTLLISH
ncbi:MAG: FecR domain-containing protein [Planctomycetaceae bacterium]|nr:FecR domain-containing protein [Planctomycetaceae bacterium]